MSERNEVIVGKPHRPLAVKAINGAGRVANALGLRPVSLGHEGLIERAIKQAGSRDFGGDEFRAGLTKLVESLEKEAELTLLGRFVARTSIEESLVKRLQLVEWRKQHPEIEHEEIRAPLFIIGLPRTGTTILHALLDQDPANRSPLFWEVQFPIPPASPETWNTDPRIEEDQKILDQLYKLTPELRAIHPMAATMPQECVAVFTMNFFSEQLFVQFHVPSYQNWLDDQDMSGTYEFHRRFLQHAQSGGVRGERWLLKSPCHLHVIETLLDTFPDAQIIHTHRDPVKVCTSSASLTAALRGVATDAIDPQAIGKEQIAWWAKLVAKALEQRKRLESRSHQFVDVKMGELVRDPLAVVRRIYEHFDLELSSEVEKRMVAFMRDNPRDKHGSHTYSAKDFGIEPDRDRAHFEEYIRYFGLDE